MYIQSATRHISLHICLLAFDFMWVFVVAPLFSCKSSLFIISPDIFLSSSLTLPCHHVYIYNQASKEGKVF